MTRRFALRMFAPASFILCFLVAPLGVFFAYSFGTSSYFSFGFGTSLGNYRRILETNLYLHLLGRSVGIGVLVGCLCVLLAYPLAYSITLGALARWGELILVLVLISLFSAYIVRVYAWRTVLGTNGAINSGLQATGLIHSPLHFLLYSWFAVVITLVNVLLPLAVLPLYAALTGIDPQVLEASESLGARPFQTFWGVTLPLSIRGVLAAFAFCCIVAGGDYVTPQLVGGASSEMIGNVIQSDFGISFNWPLGSALSFALVAVLFATIGVVVLATRIAGLRDTPS